MPHSARHWLRLVLMGVVLIGAAGVGCHHGGPSPLLPIGYQPVAQANAQIAAVQAQATVKELAIEAQIKADDAAIATLKQAQSQEASNHLFGAEVTYMVDPLPDVYSQIMHSEDVSAATTLPPPDTATVASKMDQIKKLLADKQNLINDLSANVAAAQAKATSLSAQVSTEQGQVETLKTQKAALVTATTAQITTIQGQKDVAVNAKLAKDAELLSTKASVDAVKTKVIIAAYALAALLTAAAVFSPVLRLQLVELAIVFAGAAVSLPYVQGWMVAVGLGLGLLVVVWHIVEAHTTVVAASGSATPVPAAPPAVASTTSLSTASATATSASKAALPVPQATPPAVQAVTPTTT